MARVRRLWLAASLAAFIALVVEIVFWFGPRVLQAHREPAYGLQFCLVLGSDEATACVTVEYQHSPGGTAQLYLYPDQPPQRQGTLAQRQAYVGQYQVGYEYPCYYKGNSDTATFAPPSSFNGLYLSFLGTICLLAIVMVTMYMGFQLPRSSAVLVPVPAPAPAPKAIAAVQPEPAPVTSKPLTDSTAEALRRTDENLKKRIIALATKLENERDARMDLEQRLSQTLEIVSASRPQQGAVRRSTRTNAIAPFPQQPEDV